MRLQAFNSDTPTKDQLNHIFSWHLLLCT